MLRVYSILYIEKLWNPSPTTTTILRQVPSTPSSVHITSTSLVEQEEAIVDEEQEEVLHVSPSRQITEQPEEEVEVEHEEEPAGNDNEFGVVSMEVISEEEEPLQTQEPEQEQVREVDGEGSKLDNRRDSKVSVDVSQAIADEDVVKSLTIDTQRKKPESHIEIEELFEEPAAIATSLSSNSSSLVPPATPDSIHSLKNEKTSGTSPRTTSLIRRETTKLNDRRRSLTKKLKKALSVKTSGATKRNSV